MLVHNGAVYVDGADLTDASDDTIETVMAAGATGTMLLTRHLLPLLRVMGRAPPTAT